MALRFAQSETGFPRPLESVKLGVDVTSHDVEKKDIPVKLPNAEDAIVEREKITDYLLNPAHRYGASKSAFFQEFGFSLDEWEQLADALQEHGQTFEVTKTKDTPFGPRYEIDGELTTPTGQSPRIRTVWQFDHGQTAPRFITAHPLERLT